MQPTRPKRSSLVPDRKSRQPQAGGATSPRSLLRAQGCRASVQGIPQSGKHPAKAPAATQSPLPELKNPHLVGKDTTGWTPGKLRQGATVGLRQSHQPARTGMQARYCPRRSAPGTQDTLSPSDPSLGHLGGSLCRDQAGQLLFHTVMPQCPALPLSKLG